MKNATDENLIPEEPGTWEEASKLALYPDEKLEKLLNLANRKREQYKGDRVFTCGIMNAKSGRCSQDCAFCAQSAYYRSQIETYPFRSKDEILERALNYAEAGAKRFSIVSSGSRPSERELDTVCESLCRIKRQTRLVTCASLGMLTPEMAKRLHQAGLDNYHHNLETAPSHFDKICSTHGYREDIQTIKAVQSNGLRICSGGIMGLCENWEQRAELAFELRKLQVNSIPVNFLNPIPGTPLQDRPLLAASEALKCIALFRLINPNKDIVICGGREVTLQDYQSRIFWAGANGLMIGDYLTTPGRSVYEDLEMIQSLGLKIAS